MYIYAGAGVGITIIAIVYIKKRIKNARGKEKIWKYADAFGLWSGVIRL